MPPLYHYNQNGLGQYPKLFIKNQNRIIARGGRETYFNRWVKAWILITLISLLAYELFWLNSVFIRFAYMLSFPDPLVKFPNFFSDFVASTTGEILRTLGVFLGFLAAYIYWGPKPKPFMRVKKLVAVALFFEAVYWLSLLTINVVEIISNGPAIPLFVAFILQILIAAPLLIILSSKIWRYQATAKANALKWGAIVGTGYIVGIWVNNVFRWLSMTGNVGLSFILTGLTALGFLNSLITLSLALVFAVAGLRTMSKNKKMSTKLFSLSVIMVGLHFAIYAAYMLVAPNFSLNFLLLVEIWPITLLGLGVGTLVKGEN